MGYSKVWLAMTPEERAAKRREYRANLEAKSPGIQKVYQLNYRTGLGDKFRAIASAAQKAKHRGNKLLAIEYKGGVCFDCNTAYHQACFDFHHLDPTIKDSTIAQIMGRSFKNIKAELNKCILLCANCHRIRHYHNQD